MARISGCGWILEERYLLGLLLEYAATLGLLDVALIPAAGARPDYGDLWGTDELPFFSRYDGLMYFRINPLGEYCFGMAPAYQSAPLQVKPVLRILPNLEIAAIGPDLEQGDRLALDTYATRVSEYVWRLDSGKLLAAIEEGRAVAEIREFLAACTWCRTGKAQRLPESPLLPTLPAELNTSIFASMRKEYPVALGDSRQAARFLCSLTSPALTKNKLTRHSLFGIFEDRRFADVLAWCER